VPPLGLLVQSAHKHLQPLRERTMTEQTANAIVTFITANPRCTAGEAGTTIPVLNELERKGKIKRAGKRVTGRKGKPPIEWVAADVNVAKAIANATLVGAIRDTAHMACNCPLHEHMTLADLADLKAGCTDPHSVRSYTGQIVNGEDRHSLLSEPAGYACPRLREVRTKIQTKQVELEENE
jgi:hypothetical protein